jgi:DNA-binding NtrC family response regulator
MERPRVLIVCRDQSIRRDLRLKAAAAGCQVVEEDSLFRGRVEGLRPDAIVLGSGGDAEAWQDVEAAAGIRRWNREIPVLMVVSRINTDLALAALRAGASDLRANPGGPGEFERAFESLVGARGEPQPEAERILGASHATRELRAYLDRVAATDCNVLITGETGTGKELAAERIHQMSSRRNKLLMPINCAAIPEALVESELFGYERGAFTGAHTARDGKFKLADGGTVFLDEIGDMDMGSQAKLLRVIESKEVHSLGGKAGVPLDIRVVAATNQDPERLVCENRFRKDLYFRLNVARVHLKPLRERQEDIGPLIAHAIGELNRRFGRDVEGCNEEATSLLMRYDWPGNVRELKNLLEATFIGAQRRVIAPEDFPESFRARLEPLMVSSLLNNCCAWSREAQIPPLLKAESGPL